MESVFLDSNVIANWILIKEFIKGLNKVSNDTVLTERLKRFSYSYTLIEAMTETDEYNVKTSNLALGEVFHVIYNELLAIRMYSLGVPLTLWTKLRSEHDLKSGDKYVLREIVSKYLNKLKNNAEVVHDVIDEEIYPNLILEYRLRTHDAVLLTTAIINGCSWYITNDKEIVNLNKSKKGKRKISEVFGIVPDLPENFLRAVK